MRGHSHFMRLDTAVVANKLPLTAEQAQLKVLVTGSHVTDEQLVQSSIKPYLVNTKELRSLLAFYKENNRYYKDILIDEHVMNGFVEHPDAFTVVVPPEKDDTFPTFHLSSSVAEQHEDSDPMQTYSTMTMSPAVDAAGLDTYRRLGAVLESKTKEVTSVPTKASTTTVSTLGQTRVVRASNERADEREKDLFEKMFAHLFPFGRGGPGEQFERSGGNCTAVRDPRYVPVSFHAYAQHALRLSTRQFNGKLCMCSVTKMRLIHDIYDMAMCW